MPGALDWLMRQLGGDPEAEGAAQTSTAMQPAVLDHLQNVLSDMPGRFGGVSYDSNRSLAQNAKDPGGVQQAVSIGMQVGPAAIRAYHGSPHDFDAFDINKIGTGEGAQAYGHGLYFAEEPSVAQSYRDQSGVSYWANDKKLGTVGELRDDPVALAAHFLHEGGGVEGAREQLRSSVESHIAGNYGIAPSLADRVERSIIELAPHEIEVRPSGKMYEVNLHADPEAFLNWDKPLSQHGEVARKILADNWLAHPIDHANQTGGQIYESSRIVPGDYRDPAAASAALRDAGVPGIRYLDQGSRGTGSGTSNYVMFDDKLIEILRKYGLAGLVAGAGGAAALGGGAAEAAPADALDRIRRQLGGP